MKDRINRLAARVLRRIAGTITHVVTDKPVVALSFDDGPDPEATPALLRILQTYEARATFFMCGEHAAAYPELVAAVQAAGHAIGNHSWDHPSVPLISTREALRQLRKCSQVLPAAGTRLFRPPYGHQNAVSQLAARLAGYQVVTWNVVLPDWEGHDGEWLAQTALRQVGPGSIILLHDGLVDYQHPRQLERSASLDAVARILERLRESYQFVTIPELLEAGRPVRVNWLMKPDVDFLNGLQRRVGAPRRYAPIPLTTPWLGYNR